MKGKIMKLFIILDNGIYHPRFLYDFLRQTEDEVVGAAIITRIPDKNNIEKYFQKHFFYLNLQEIVKLFLRKISLIMGNILCNLLNKPSIYSVKAIIKLFKIPYIEINDNINNRCYLDYIQQSQPDIIISSNPLIFGKELLSIPRYGCINRHSALLPRYGGVLPVFQAVKNREKNTGVTIHIMEEKIDTGAILEQIPVPIKKEDTLDTLYKKCFSQSVIALLAAIKKIKSDNGNYVKNRDKPSYFSWPAKKDWELFRLNGGKVI